MLRFSFTVRDLEYFLLLLTRITCFVHTAPIFSTGNVPRRFKVIFSLCIASLLYEFMLSHAELEYSTLIGYAALVLKEASCGLIIGFVGNMCMSMLQFAGSLTDMDIGLSMVSLFDPVTRQQTGFSGSLYQYAFLLMLLVSGQHHYILRAFIEGYSLIPLGHSGFNANLMLTAMMGFITNAFLVALRIYLPIYATMILLNSTLGVLAKVAPQMNMFAVGIQLKIFVGFTALILTARLLPMVSDFVFQQMRSMMTDIVRAMA
ncbi:MAG: flagellar biosynthetic protein FliR [Lachnospiraceae bacterium]|nr:flagellar biosynthetic protein FliR [Lachnospiraceae bacterium]